MKYFYRILLAMLACSYLSCSSDKGDESSDLLKVDLGKSNSILIPAPASTQSCDQEARGDTSGAGGVSGSYFTLANPNISWTEPTDATVADSTSEIRIIVLKLTLVSPKLGGEYTCVLSDVGLGSLFYDRVVEGDKIVVNVWDRLLSKNSGAQVNSTKEMVTSELFTPCEIKCGGITIQKGSGQFSVSGTWELLAVRRKYATASSIDYEEFPIKVMGTFTVDNTLD